MPSACSWLTGVRTASVNRVVTALLFPMPMLLLVLAPDIFEE
ncbi:hypothetical protein [Streptomyces sp. NPDC002845]